jgi:hypothetical protein
MEMTYKLIKMCWNKSDIKAYPLIKTFGSIVLCS